MRSWSQGSVHGPEHLNPSLFVRAGVLHGAPMELGLALSMVIITNALFKKRVPFWKTHVVKTARTDFNSGYLRTSIYW